MATFNIEEYLDSLPSDIEKINIFDNNITYIPSLERFYQLKVLDCSYNRIKQLDEDDLPLTLEILYCDNNLITQLDNLPNRLTTLYCHNNQIEKLDNLPNSLEKLYCSYNKIKQLDNLPNCLRLLHCYNNQITQLDNLPNSLEKLYCSYNQLTQLDNLPHRLEMVWCNNNQITQLNNLPQNLEILYCSHNPLSSFRLGYWKGISKFRKIYFTSKYGSRLERYYIKNIRNKIINKDFLDILYSPDFKFYKRLLDPTIQKLFY
jgi:Leucine-rich repeat (LRR) protein